MSEGNSPTEQFTQFIKGKRVIFVGPAPTLIGSNRGKEIDSYDVVVRTNGAIALCCEKEQYRTDYGSRTDVLACNVQFHRECGPFLNILDTWMRVCGLKFLNMKTVPQRFRKEYLKKLPVRTLQHIEAKLKKTIAGLLMGPIVIEDLLSFHPKELYVTGMNFYANKPKVFIPGDYREYYPDYLPEKIRKRADIANIGRIDPHDKKSNTKYIYMQWQRGNIQMDDEMVRLAANVIKGEI